MKKESIDENVVSNKKIENRKSSVKNDNLFDSIGRNAEPILKILTQLAKDILEYNKGERDFETQMEKDEKKFNTRMGVIAALLVVFVVSVAAWLTFLNKIDGATFTFLLGIVVGYMLLFFRDAIFPNS